MSLHHAPVPLARRRQGPGALVALGLIIAGIVICIVAVAVLSARHADRVRQWRQPASVAYRAGNHVAVRHEVVTLWHAYTWGHLVGVGYNRYEMVVGQDPSGSYGHQVPSGQTFGPPTGNPSGIRVTWKSSGVVVAYPGGDHAFVPAKNLATGR